MYVNCIFLINFTHLLGEAHDLQSVALPSRRVGANIHQLIHLLHSFDCGDLGPKSQKSN